MTQTITQQAAPASTPIAAQPPRVSLAMATDPERALHLAPNFQPDVDMLTAEGWIAFGVKGSGKSNLLALLVEQLGRFLLPQLILDSEGEQHSLLPLLPHGVLASAQRCPSGADILHRGLQVIVDLHSWGSDEAAALAMCQLIDELFVASTAIAAHDRFPCAIHLDEAAYWLPQNAVTYLGKETRKTVVDTFHKLASRGRKQGLTPFLYTQSISEVRKETIRQAGIQVLMRQTLDIDVNRACESIYGATEKTRAALRAFSQGKAFVILPDGSQQRVQFHARQSEHRSHTPRVQTALVKFAATVDLSALPMRDMTSPAQTQKQQQQQATESSKAKRPAQPQTATERIYEFLSVNPALRPVELMSLVGCSGRHAGRARRQYVAMHPRQPSVEVAQPTPKTATERMYEFLSVNPALRPAELMRLVGCSETHAARACRQYFAMHPEQQPPQRATQPRATRLQEGYERLLAQGISPVTYEQLAQETHVGHDAVRAFLQAKRCVKQEGAHAGQQAARRML